MLDFFHFEEKLLVLFLDCLVAFVFHGSSLCIIQPSLRSALSHAVINREVKAALSGIFYALLVPYVLFFLELFIKTDTAKSACLHYRPPYR